MFASKPGVPKKRLRLHVAGQEEPYQFSFTSAGTIAENELDTFKKLLATVVSSNAETSNERSTAPNISKVQSPAAPSTPRTPFRPSPNPYSRSSSATPSKSGGRFAPEIYSRVLTKHPDLAELHRILVEGKQVTEQEFWEGREVSSVVHPSIPGGLTGSCYLAHPRI